MTWNVPAARLHSDGRRLSRLSEELARVGRVMTERHAHLHGHVALMTMSRLWRVRTHVAWRPFVRVKEHMPIHAGAAALRILKVCQ